MAQKFLVSSNKQELIDLRDDFINNHSEVCLPHKENGCWYGEITESVVAPNEWMLGILAEAEPFLSEDQVAALQDNAPINFIDEYIV